MKKLPSPQANARARTERIHELNQIGGLQEEVANLKADADRLKADVERLTKAGDKLHAFLINYIVEGRISSEYLNKLDDGWNAAKGGETK